MLRMKSGRDPGDSDVSMDLIAACRKVKIQAMVGLYQRVLDELEMPTI